MILMNLFLLVDSANLDSKYGPYVLQNAIWTNTASENWIKSNFEVMSLLSVFKTYKVKKTSIIMEETVSVSSSLWNSKF